MAMHVDDDGDEVRWSMIVLALTNSFDVLRERKLLTHRESIGNSVIIGLPIRISLPIFFLLENEKGKYLLFFVYFANNKKA